MFRFFASLCLLALFVLPARSQIATTSSATTTTTTQTQAVQPLLVPQVQQPLLIPQAVPMIGYSAAGGCGVGGNLIGANVGYGGVGFRSIGYNGVGVGHVGFRGAGVGVNVATPFVGGGFNSVSVANRGLFGRRTVVRVR